MNDTPANHPDASYWKCKLAAFLHDPPSKALGIYEHELRAAGAYKRARLEDYIKGYDFSADHTAAAADRIPWPSGKISCTYDGVNNRFHHPLRGCDQLPAQSRPLCVTDAEGTESDVQPQLELPEEWDEGCVWRAHFFAHWRLWRRNCTEANPALGFLPADTRLPDHTIWHHMGIVSALAGTAGKPAFLKFHLGPVQDFIAAARNTRDLWSGSYLISWLMATGLAALAREIGPDAVVFPSLHGQPLFDLQFRDELWIPARTSHQPNADTVWKSLAHEPADLLTPNFPNVFLAIVPAPRAAELAKLVTDTIQVEWEKIAKTVWKFAQPIVTTKHAPLNAEARFDAQVKHHLETAWQVTAWPKTPDEALATAEKLLPPGEGNEPNAACKRLRDLIAYFTQTMPAEHRDGRYYVGGKDGTKTQLNNVGLAWSVLVALNRWQLDAARQTRAFNAWGVGGWEGRSTHNTKDALNGREELIVGGAKWLEQLPETGPVKWKTLFRHSDEVGASTLIKRLWHLAYLEKVWDLPATPERGFIMPNTQEIAAGPDNEGRYQEGDGTPDSSTNERTPYFAVLALDGDFIGKIVSGERTPLFHDQLAHYEEKDAPKGAVPYFAPELLKLQRPLSPGYHLQFSEALSNFALHCVRPIVEAHHGRVLYAGGDDVLAMLPANEALVCADALQRAFRGEAPHKSAYHLEQLEKTPGFLARTDRRAPNGKAIPFIVPGPACTASVGIAIAHAKAPLQDVVRAAQAAEKRAKQLNPQKKHAIAVTVMKRSGEITQWACPFGLDSDANYDAEHGGNSGLSVVWWLLHAISDEILSRKFPHRLIQLIEPYCSTASASGHSLEMPMRDLTDFDVAAVVGLELRTTLDRQRGKRWDTEPAKTSATVERITMAMQAYFTAIGARSDRTATARISDLIGLLTVTAFLLRQGDTD